MGKERLEKLKKEYEQIEVPKEAKERILEGIEKAHNEKRKTRPFKIVKRTGVCAAACFACMVIVVNSSQTFARAVEGIPVIGALAKVVNFRTYENKTNNFYAHVDIPEVKDEDPAGKPEKDSQEQKGNLDMTNKKISQYADELIKTYENELKASGGAGNYALESTYQVVSETEDYLAIEIDTTVVMAGGTEYKKVFNIDKSTGAIVSLKDFFSEGSAYKKWISDDIKRQMREQMAADENRIYFLDSDMPEDDFHEITDDTSFYFDGEGNLVILFDEYEVAPGYMGAVSFTVDREVFRQGLLYP